MSAQSNEYVDGILGGPGNKLYVDTPKAVFAALAISLAAQLGEDADDFAPVIVRLAHEWWCLHNNGIVTQPVSAALRLASSAT